MTARAHQRLRGFLLLEVVVALLLFSLGLLGMVKLQARASQLAVDAEDRSRAALLANEMVAAMWAQRTLAVDADTLKAWKTKVNTPAAGGLPDGRGDVTLNNPQLAIVTVMWSPVAGKALVGDHQYITKVVIP
jgi:type IV pilus assembly protein PilV